MLKLDPRLHSLIRRHDRTGFSLSEATELTGFDEQSQLVEFLVRCSTPEAEALLYDAGMNIWGVIPGPSTVMTGTAAIEKLEQISQLDGVERVEASRPMDEELDLARADTEVDILHTPPQVGEPIVLGAGVTVGIIDSGIDYRHPNFLNDDGSSRILFLWDQRVSGIFNNVPFGREFTKAELDAALKTNFPLSQVNHQDRRGHGTHVAGIAAGNGRAAPAFRGIAPEADLIVVASRSDGETLGRSASALRAYQYIVDRANGNPVVINQSQGMNGGGHSGETALETGIDNLLRMPNIVAVKSAGNEQRWRIHAGGQIADGQVVTLEFRVPQQTSRTAILELWYDGADTISVSVQPPGEPALPFVTPDQGGDTFDTQADNEVSIAFDQDADNTGDTQATIELSRHHVLFLRPGTWRLRLQGDQVQHGRYDVWIERTRRRAPSQQARFTEASADNTRTISVPGTAQRIITVGSYITRDAAPPAFLPIRDISNFSSHGPTRYGMLKPEITAPGQWIISARSSDSNRSPDPDQDHTRLSGTSMAAPHVAGVAALILSQRPGLTCDQVKQVLIHTARIDSFSDTAPDNTWGNGKVDAEAAVNLARTVRFPQILNVQVNGLRLEWETDMLTTATVRFHTHKRRLLLGRSLGSRAILISNTSHSVNFGLLNLDQGTYFCEILAFSDEGLWTTDDNNGRGYLVAVP